jgi:putative ABC transport system permease protein
MMREAPRPLVNAAVTIYRLILLAYPRDFRARCAVPMIVTFRELCETRFAAGPAAAVRTCLDEYASAIAGIWSSRRPRVAPGPGRRIGAGAVQDVRFALRRLRAEPAIVLLTTITLGFALAATTAMFSIVDAAMLRPSPFPEPERLVRVMNHSTRTGMTYPGLSRDKLRQWRTEVGIFAAVEAYRRTSVLVTGGAEPEELQAALVSPRLMSVLGLAPREGRLFTPEEGAAGAANVAIVSESYWRTRLGRDENVIGRPLQINGTAHRIVGVMPARFQFPTGNEQLWIPFDPDARGGEAAGITEILARLAPGLSLATVMERVAASIARLEVERPVPTGWSIRLSPSSVSGPDDATRRAVLILFGAVGLVLLTACANVANLLLSRAIDRQREFAIRLALGAGRGRILRELLAEGVLLGLAAGALGLAAARWALGALVGVAPDGLLDASAATAGIDARVFTFAAVIALTTGVLCNLAPAFRAWRARGHEALTGRTKSASETPLQRSLRGALVLAEVALAVVLLVGAALMVRSFNRLNAIDIGFDTRGLLAVTVGLDTARYGSEPERMTFLQHVASDAAQLPGVTGVAVAASLPPSPGTVGLAQLETDAGPCLEERTRVFANQVSPAFFPLLGIRTSSGRMLRDDDAGTAVVLGSGLARLCGGSSMVGRRIRLDPSAPWLQVVGIAADVKTTGLLGEEGELAFYLPLHGNLRAALPMTALMVERRVAPRRLVIRSERGPGVLDEMKRVLWARDAGQPVLRAAPLSELMGESIRRERFMLLLLTVFSCAALALASAGIFGVLAYGVSRRTSEIGIRLALGAAPGDVLRLVLRQGVLLIGGGTVAGLAGAFAMSRLLAGLLYEVDPHDPVAFAAIPVLVLIVGLAASWLPARRALRVDPATALRVD